ncbi:hypothetical protein AB1Y20_014720 [Prymnesium parvum]|uniref:Cilia- and flagella-associated protein 36 n=1 Tax=Prymnesium parvum TaxID=97485 RepID=A0AB34IDY0_PRYPA
MSAEERVWLFDSIIGFLKGPYWALPVMSFIDENCIIFDSEDENKLAYMDIYAAFREMVESLMEMHMKEMGCTPADFAELCAQYGSTDVGRDVMEQILAVDDFVAFKEMMVRRNMELELESLRALQALSARIANHSAAEEEEEMSADERQLQEALELSLKEAEEKGIHTGIDAAEIERRRLEAEEADIRLAIAMSLQMEEERAKLAAAAAEPPPAAPLAPPEPEPLPSEPLASQPAAPPAEPSDAPAASSSPPARSISGAGLLAPLQSKGLPPMATSHDLRAAQAAAHEASLRAAEARARAEKEREVAQQALMNQEMSISRAAEVRARAEHLRKQRDILLAKRKKEREEHFKNEPAAAPSESAEARSMPPQSELKKAAGYTELDHRASLSRALAANMKASLLGDDVATMELQQRIEQHQRKAEFAQTKADLLAEAEAAKARG